MAPMDAGITGGMTLLGAGGKPARDVPDARPALAPGTARRRAAVPVATVLLALSLTVGLALAGEELGADRGPQTPVRHAQDGAEGPRPDKVAESSITP